MCACVDRSRHALFSAAIVDVTVPEKQQRGPCMSEPVLRLPGEQMRAVGRSAVEAVVEHVSSLRDQRVGRPPDRGALEALVAGPPPVHPRDPSEVLDEVVEFLHTGIVHTDHPRFLAYVPGPSNFIGAVADFLAAGFNVFAGQWLVGAGPAVMERVTVSWLADLCGLPNTADGLFVSGGTQANLIAIHAARTRRGHGQLYVTSQTHRSIRSGLSFLGFVDDEICEIAADEHHRMNIAALVERIERDRRTGRRPTCVIATAGTTSTGAVDPLADLADLCAQEGLWLHVDGAYGGAAVLSERAAPQLAGLDRADSIALDPHKWWYQPYESGCVLVRDTTALTDAYRFDAEYLTETRHGDGPINFYDRGPQLTRGFRALKLWMSIQTFGLDAFRRAVDHSISLAEHVQARLADHAFWDIVTPAQLAVVTFRPRTPDLSPDDVDLLVRRLPSQTLADGHALVTTTMVDGRPALRLCTIHPETTSDDLDDVIERLECLTTRLRNDSE